MKVKALRTFWYKDEKTARMLIAHKGEELILDHFEQAVMVYELLQSRSIEVIDKTFIPGRATYKVVFGISYETKEGFPRAGSVGNEIELDQSTACRYMASGHIKPVNESQWRPAWLLGDTEKDKVVRMFDDDELGPPRQSAFEQLRNHKVRNWRD